jgi:hypothetical protein
VPVNTGERHGSNVVTSRPRAGLSGDEPTPPAAGAIDAPDRGRLLFVGVTTYSALVAATLAQKLTFPHDATYQNVLYLMWSANLSESWIAIHLTTVVSLMALGTSVMLIGWGVLRPESPRPAFTSLLRWSYRFAPCWVLLTLLSTSLGRAIANVVYVFAPSTPGESTVTLARLEGPLLARIQALAGHDWIGAASASIYSWVWTIGVLGFGPWLILRGRARAVDQVIVAIVLTGVLALPFFLLLPVFDPWATNPMYGYQGSGQTVVRYLYPGADLSQLSAIATMDRWATGSCLPSLHFAFPMVLALLAARHRLRAEAWVLAGLTIAVGGAVVYLGRHWIADVAVAVPYSLGIVWLVGKIDPRITLSWSPSRKVPA